MNHVRESPGEQEVMQPDGQSSAPELRILGVSKTYANGVHALKDVTLTIPAGMYGLLGPNGAGKSTLMRIIATLQEPDEGSVQLGDIDVVNQKEEVRKTLGYLPQEFGVYPKVSAQDLLDHFALLKGIADRHSRKSASSPPLNRARFWASRCTWRSIASAPARRRSR
jgi:ABC-type multidrug transport system ATPase subunit